MDRCFCKALNLNYEELQVIYGEDEVRVGICNTVRGCKENIDELYKVSDKIRESLLSREFLNIAQEYLPDHREKNVITVNLVVFGDNAFGVGDQMILDVPFLGKVNKPSILLAHELHHMIRSKFEVVYDFDKEYSYIEHLLFWFETEGIANLCNFEEMNYMYEEMLGLESGYMARVMENSDKYLRKVNEIIKAILNHRDYDKKFAREFGRNAMFHPISYVMAKRILEIGGGLRIKSIVGDIVGFFKAYNECAMKSESFYYFDEEVMAGIEQVLVAKS